jgi:hypothetical protein
MTFSWGWGWGLGDRSGKRERGVLSAVTCSRLIISLSATYSTTPLYLFNFPFARIIKSSLSLLALLYCHFRIKTF